MGARYFSLFTHFLPMIETWQTSVIVAFTAVINLMIQSSDATKDYVTKEPKLIHCLVQMTGSMRLCSKIQPTAETEQSVETRLVDNTLTLLLNITNKARLLAIFRETPNVVQTFMKLKDPKYVDRIQLQAYILLGKILSEDEIKTLIESKKITEVILKYLKNANESEDRRCQGIPISTILSGLKCEHFN
jgi:hypothetical protein